MDDTDNDLSDGELGSEAEEDGGLVRLPCDQPWWPEVSQVLAQLATSTDTEAIVTSVGKLAEIVHGEAPGDALRHFLEAECGEEERGWIEAAILPAMASLALELPSLKPFLGVARPRPGEFDCRSLHPDLVSSLLAHSFLSTTGRAALDLGLASLAPEATETHWKLRCYFSHFHRLLQAAPEAAPPQLEAAPPPGSRGNVTIVKEVTHSAVSGDQQQAAAAGRRLIRFLITEDITAAPGDSLTLTLCEDWGRGLLAQASPLTSEFTLKQPELLLPFLYLDQLHPAEAVRLLLPGRQLGLVTRPRLAPAPAPGWVEATLAPLLEITAPWPRLEDRVKSLLRRPSVAAVTSCATQSPASPASPASADSCAEDARAEERVSPVSAVSPLLGRPGHRRNKTRKKESFKERLAAALERGNTPDTEAEAELSSPAAPRHERPGRRPPLPLHRRIIRRQRSSGFRAFTDAAVPVEDSAEEFFTATEDERSHTPARGPGPLVMARAAPVTRRQLLQDKSFDSVRSSSQSRSRGPVTSPSPPLSSLLTSSSQVDTAETEASDSDSFSSAGLGMPRLGAGPMEELCDQLQGCLQTEDGSLQYRDTQLRRAAAGLRLRSLSESYAGVISDLEAVGMPGVRSLASGDLLPPATPRSLSLPDLAPAPTEARPPVPSTAPSTLVTHGLGSCCEEGAEAEPWAREVWPLLVWVAASCQPHLQEVVFRVTSAEEALSLRRVVEAVTSTNWTASELLSCVTEFIQFIQIQSNHADFYTFLNDKINV